jgi:hypothetical protein
LKCHHGSAQSRTCLMTSSRSILCNRFGIIPARRVLIMHLYGMNSSRSDPHVNRQYGTVKQYDLRSRWNRLMVPIWQTPIRPSLPQFPATSICVRICATLNFEYQEYLAKRNEGELSHKTRFFIRSFTQCYVYKFEVETRSLTHFLLSHFCAPINY